MTDTRHLGTAHVWLFSAGIDASALDTHGTPLARSLADLLGVAERDGRRKAASRFLQESSTPPPPRALHPLERPTREVRITPPQAAIASGEFTVTVDEEDVIGPVESTGTYESGQLQELLAAAEALVNGSG